MNTARRASALVCAVSALLLPSQPILGVITATPVTVYVTVKGGDGSQLETSLKQDAFQVRSDDTLVPIESFALVRVPATIVVLFDLTGSVDLGPTSDRETLAAFDAGFVERLEAGDRVRIGSIASSPSIGRSFVSTKADVRSAAAQAFSIPADHRYGPSPIWDTVDSAIDVLDKEQGRRVIVAHTDGISTGDRLRRQDVVLRAAAADVTLMFIAPRGQRAEANLRAAAQSTGGSYLLGFGRALREPTAPRLGEAFSQVLDELRNAYTLTFAAPVADGNLHRLDVRVAGRFHAVLARQVYRAPSSFP